MVWLSGARVARMISWWCGGSAVFFFTTHGIGYVVVACAKSNLQSHGRHRLSLWLEIPPSESCRAFRTLPKDERGRRAGVRVVRQDAEALPAGD